MPATIFRRLYFKCLVLFGVRRLTIMDHDFPAVSHFEYAFSENSSSSRYLQSECFSLTEVPLEDEVICWIVFDEVDPNNARTEHNGITLKMVVLVLVFNPKKDNKGHSGKEALEPFCNRLITSKFSETFNVSNKHVPISVTQLELHYKNKLFSKIVRF